MEDDEKSRLTVPSPDFTSDFPDMFERERATKERVEKSGRVDLVGKCQ